MLIQLFRVKPGFYFSRFLMPFYFLIIFACFLSQPEAARATPAADRNPSRIFFAGQEAELAISLISDTTLRVTLLPVSTAGSTFLASLNSSPVLEAKTWPQPIFRSSALTGTKTIPFKDRQIIIQAAPLTIKIIAAAKKSEPKFSFETEKGRVAFLLGARPVYGLGGGGQTFDRRGTYDAMNNGHRSGEYQIFGSRVPIPLLISAEGWAVFVHRPYNMAFDLRQNPSSLEARHNPREEKEAALPLDLFIILSDSPAQILNEYAQLTGRPVMPPRWALGYFQSHRTLAGPEEIIAVAENFRKRQLPCDGLIYLGTGYCPAGWNLGHGTLEFNPKTFPEPEKIIQRLHELNFKVILHKNNAPRTLHGSFPPQPEEKPGPDHIAAYWKRHRPVYRMGIDGWWPDDGDELPIDSRLARHFIYYAGPLSDRPNQRPFSLHRTGYAGMQRYGGWVWSGDVFSLWDTLAAHVPIGVNFSLSASPYWGTDIGGFWPTPEFTGELYLRWFQFMCFAPVFRSHGRVWHLRLPWGWNRGEAGPPELSPDMRGTGLCDAKEFRNPEVEPICRQYLNLRYQLLPYNYTLAREAYDTGLPFMRALFLHYPDDAEAAERGDEYLWGRDILVAPVVEKGATKRRVYLPEGRWYDFWTNAPVMGKQEVFRYVDIATIPIYIRSGAIIPFGPVVQFTDEPSQEPLTIRVYTGADGQFCLYEDDGRTLDYQQNNVLWIRFTWKDQERTLKVDLDPRSKIKLAAARTFEILLLPERKRQTVSFNGEPLEIKL